MKKKRALIMISTDRLIFVPASPVAARMIEYGRLFSDIHIIVFSKKSLKLKNTKLDDNVSVYPTASWTRAAYTADAMSTAINIISLLKKKSFEVAITCQDPFETGMAGARLKNLYGYPLQIQVHTDFLSPYYKKNILNRVRVPIAKEILKKADQIRVVSKRIEKSISKLFPESKIKVLPIFVDKEKRIKRSLHKSSDQRFNILMVSRLEPEKNYECAFSAFAKVHRHYPDARLYVVGTGSELTRLKKLASNLEINLAVYFEGWKTDLTPYYSEASIFLSSSWYEGYGAALMESALAKVPIVTTDVGIAGEILKNGINSFVCQVNDSECIAASLIALMKNKKLRDSFATKLFRDIKISLPGRKAYFERHKRLFDELYQGNARQ